MTTYITPYKALKYARISPSMKALRGELFSKIPRPTTGQYSAASRIVARSIQRWYKNRRKSSKYAKRMAKQPSISTKTSEFRENGGTFNIQQLKLFPIRFPPQGTGTGDRNRIFIRLKGVNICFCIKNIEPDSSTRNFMCHFALLQPKCDTSNEGTTAATRTAAFLADISPEFFRDTVSDQERESPFVNFVPSTTPSLGPFEMKYNCLSLNKDKMNVLCHWRKMLYSSNVASGFRRYWEVKKYIKIKRKFIFDNPTDIQGKFPIYLAFWVYPCTETDWTDWKTRDNNSNNNVCVDLNYQTKVFFN